MSEEQSRRFRASDADREQVAEQIRQAMTEGRLSLTEGEERLAAVYGATYQDELGGFTQDLPPAGPAPGAASEPAGAAGTGPTGATGPGPAGGQCRGPRLGFFPLLLAGALAVLATGWAVLGSGPVWPAILLGVIAVIGIKHRWYAYLRTHQEAGRPFPRWAGHRGWADHAWSGHHGWAGHAGPGHWSGTGHQSWTGNRR